MSIDRDDLAEITENKRSLDEQASGRNDAGATRLAPATFLRHVVNRVNAGVYRPGQTLNCQLRGSLAKFWYGADGSIHYEIWVHERTAQLELGLHCESTPDYNRALYKAFDVCMVEIQDKLGNSFWLEEWDHGWVRLYETHPLYPLDTYRVEEIASRLGEIIGALQPLYEKISAGLSAPTLVPPESRHRQSRWRR
jgi:hypothetical protein